MEGRRGNRNLTQTERSIETLYAIGQSILNDEKYEIDPQFCCQEMDFEEVDRMVDRDELSYGKFKIVMIGHKRLCEYRRYLDIQSFEKLADFYQEELGKKITRPKRTEPVRRTEDRQSTHSNVRQWNEAATGGILKSSTPLAARTLAPNSTRNTSEVNQTDVQQSTPADALLPISEDVEMPIVELAPEVSEVPHVDIQPGAPSLAANENTVESAERTPNIPPHPPSLGRASSMDAGGQPVTSRRMNSYSVFEMPPLIPPGANEAEHPPLFTDPGIAGLFDTRRDEQIRLDLPKMRKPLPPPDLFCDRDHIARRRDNRLRRRAEREGQNSNAVNATDERQSLDAVNASDQRQNSNAVNSTEQSSTENRSEIRQEAPADLATLDIIPPQQPEVQPEVMPMDADLLPMDQDMPIDESAGAGAVTIPPVPAIGLVFGSRRTLEEDIREDMRLFRTRMVGPKPARSKSQTDNPPPHHVSLNSDDMLPELRAHFATISQADDKDRIPIGSFLHGNLEQRNRDYRALIGMITAGIIRLIENQTIVQVIRPPDAASSDEE